MHDESVGDKVFVKKDFVKALLAAKVPKTAAEAGSGPRLFVTAAMFLNKELGYTKADALLILKQLCSFC